MSGIQELYGKPSEVSTLELRVAAHATLDRTSDKKVFSLTAPRSLAVTIDGPDDADFDLYVKRGETPTEDSFDYRAWTVTSNERIVFPIEAGAEYFVVVRSYEGGGEFDLKVEAAES